MRVVKVVLAFQGTRYQGWQSQRNGKTVQEVFQTELSRILKTETVAHGSSRTDAGVHAKGFVAHFKTKSSIPDHKLRDALNYYLPADIVVLSARTVGETFHARFSAKAKTYQYDIWTHRVRPAYDMAPFVLWVPQKLDLNAMRKAARHLVGKHDFNAFRDSGDEEKNTVRNIKRLSITRKGSLVSIKVSANGFLKHMIRVVVGTLMEVGKGRLTIKHTKSLLESKDRKKSGPTIKPQGLTLLKVQY